jgi:NAD(P)-dependent dehydrogenase (short-subunit alcohol dehydrogenase family)
MSRQDETYRQDLPSGPDRIDLAGKAALVTGASRGIGRAIARTFAHHGARIGVHYQHNEAAAQRTLASLAGEGHCLLAADLADPEQATVLVATAVARLGSLDILVNNAGIYEQLSPLEASPESWRTHWQRTLAINLLGPAWVTLPTVQQMVAGGGGHIVNISSRGASRGEPTALAYGASKAGLNAMSQSLAQAVAPHNIIVTVIAPGFVATDMTAEMLAGEQGAAIRGQSPLNRVASVNEVASVALFLVSGQADYLTGAIVDLNGASYLRS